MKQKLLFITLCALHLFTLAQTPALYNNGATITITLGTTMQVKGGLTNNTGTLTNVGTLQIARAINNTGTLTSTAGTVELIGSTSQTIPANTFSGNTLLNLKISNTSVTSTGVLNITGALSFGNVNNSIFNTSGLLTLKSTATNTAIVADFTNDGTNSGNTITGNVSVERFIPARRAWKLLTAPFRNTGSIFANWQNGGTVIPGTGAEIWKPGGDVATDGLANGPQPSMKMYDAASNIWVGVLNTRTGLLSTNSGTNGGSADNNSFLLFVTSPFKNGAGSILSNTTPEATTLTATGALQTGNQSFPINKYQYSLIGNPYASPVNFQTLKSHNTAINSRFWTYDATQSTLGAYRLVYFDGTNYRMVPASPYTTSGSDAAAGNYLHIQSGQAVFFENSTWNGTTGTAGMVTFSETDKSTINNVPVFRTSVAHGVMGELSINFYKDGNLVDGALGLWNATYSNAIIGSEDAGKPTNQGENIAITNGDKPYMVEARNSIVAIDTTNLWVWGMSSGQNYKLSIAAKDLPLNGLTPYLVDKYNATATVLNTAGVTDYSFTTTDAASMLFSRFAVVYKPASTLPVSYITVKATQKGVNQVEVSWTAAGETNVQKYEVEKSVDGNNFNYLGARTINVGSTVNNYTFTDANATGTSYYRIKAIDRNGFKYSAIVKVVISAQGQAVVSIYPNPLVGRQLNLQFSALAEGNYTINVYDADGKKVANEMYKHIGGSTTKAFTLPVLSTGNYKVEVRGANQSFVNNLVIKH